MGITVLIGAGAAVEIGAPSTTNLTKEVLKKKQTFHGKESAFIRKIAKTLDAYYKGSLTFEDIYHAIDQIDTYSASWKPTTVKRYKPPFGAFCRAIDPKLFSDPITIIQAKKDLIKVVADKINVYDDVALQNPTNGWYINFWKELVKTAPLSITTLNYDTTVDRILPELETGFESTEHSFKRFNPKLLDKTNGCLMHLHGSINFGYIHIPNINQYTLEDDHEDLYLFDNYKDATRNWFGRSTNVSQSGDRATIGPIITGLNKTDKLLSAPYIFYNSKFTESIKTNNALLIVGYSFNDIYLNSIIKRMARIHGDRRRIVIISKTPHKSYPLHHWAYDMSNDWALGILYAFGITQFPHEFRPRDKYVSDKGTGILYPHGFKKTVEKHMDELFNFLLS